MFLMVIKDFSLDLSWAQKKNLDMKS